VLKDSFVKHYAHKSKWNLEWTTLNRKSIDIQVLYAPNWEETCSAWTQLETHEPVLQKRNSSTSMLSILVR
jgi:hypothetical protein